MVVEAVKQAEEGPDVIVRLYEAAGRATEATLRCGFPVSTVAEVNLLEQSPQPLAVADGTVALSLRPFEIKTLRLKA